MNIHWERISPFSNSERTACGRGEVKQTCSTSGTATKWKAIWPGGQLDNITTKRGAKREAERHINAATGTLKGDGDEMEEVK